MVWVRVVWWRVLFAGRVVGRFVCARVPHAASTAVRARFVLHALVGNPARLATTTAAALAALSAGVNPWLVLAWLAATTITIELGLAWALDHGTRLAVFGWLVAWRQAWMLRRRLPRAWGDAAAKTGRVQAEVGTSAEPLGPAVLREILDHPPVGWWPTIRWPVVAWWVGPPPGRTMTAWDEIAPVLAAQWPQVADITVDYEQDTSSVARMIVTFITPTTSTGLTLDTPDPTPAARLPEPAGPVPVDDHTAVVVALDPTTSPYHYSPYDEVDAS